MVVAVAAFAATFVAEPAYAANDPTTSTLPLSPVNNNPGLNLGGAGLALFVAIIVGVLVVLLFAPVVYSALLTARSQRRQEKFARSLLERTKPRWNARNQPPAPGPPPHSADDFVKILDAYRKLGSTPASTDGQGTLGQGLTTTLIALAILTLVGVALVVVLVSSSTDAGDLRKTIITALLSILASISGFYFAARTAQDAARQAQGGGDDTVAPTFTSAKPPATAEAGSLYFYRFEATGSPPPKYRLAGNAPDWLTIDSAKGTVSGTPAEGQYEYSVLASNSAGSVGAGPFSVTVSPR